MKREERLKEQIEKRGIKNKRVLNSILNVKRDLFVPEQEKEYAYGDFPVPIGSGQTISQPYVVAFMTEQIDLRAEHRVLEIGTGSGYQTAVLAEQVKEVYTVEIIEALYYRSKQLLEELGYKNIFCKLGDGYQGWPENSPYDRIIITAAPKKIPETVMLQLKTGGKMIVPVGEGKQSLLLIEKKKNDNIIKELLPVRFVPMVRGN